MVQKNTMIFVAIVVVYLFFALLAYGKLPFTFFQQDEWAIFGNYLYWEKAQLSWWERLFIYEQDTHIVPLGNFFSYLQFSLFDLRFTPYAIVGIILHMLNAFLVYRLSTILTNNKKIGFLAGLFFLVNVITHQAVTWVATVTGTVGSTFFILLSLIFFLKFLRQEKIRSLLLSCLFLLISLLFKETSLFSFLFFPFLWIIYGKRKNVLEGAKIFSPFFVLGILYMCFRIYFFLFGYHTSFPEELSQPNINTYVYRLFTSPLKFITQTFIPVEFIIAIAGTIVVLGYPQFVQYRVPDPYLVESIASDIVSYALAFFITGLCILLFKNKRLKDLGFWKISIACLFFITVSSLPFLVIPGKAGYFSLLDGRHLYLTSSFGVILIATIVTGIYIVLGKKRIILGVLTILVIGYIGIQGYKIRGDLNKQMASAYIRQLILNKITKTYPNIPSKSVFYLESDAAYYGLPSEEKIVPFQSGFGQTLLVWYNAHSEQFPACFFKAKYLYVLISQDYKECEGRGFGYYRKFDLLQAAVRFNKLSRENIFAFRFYSHANKLDDITSEIRKKMQL